MHSTKNGSAAIAAAVTTLASAVLPSCATSEPREGGERPTQTEVQPAKDSFVDFVENQELPVAALKTTGLIEDLRNPSTSPELRAFSASLLETISSKPFQEVLRGWENEASLRGGEFFEVSSVVKKPSPRGRTSDESIELEYVVSERGIKHLLIRQQMEANPQISERWETRYEVEVVQPARQALEEYRRTR